MRHLLFRILLLAVLLAAVLERLAFEMHDVWCRCLFRPFLSVLVCMWPRTVILVLLLPGGLVTNADRSDLRMPTSSGALAVVAISALAWALAIVVVWHVLRRVWRGSRLLHLAWRPWLTWAMAIVSIALGAWSAQLRATDLRAFERCQRVIAQIPVGASRAEARDAILEARPYSSDLDYEELSDPDVQRIDTYCREVYGLRGVIMHVHLSGDTVERVDRECPMRSTSCDVEEVDCSAGKPLSEPW